MQTFNSTLRSVIWLTVCYTVYCRRITNNPYNYAKTLIDLSHSYDENAAHWVDAKPFHFTSKAASTDWGFFYATNSFETGEHVGTHIDAPYQFNKDNWKVADIPIDRLFINGIKIDARKEAAANPNYGLEVSKLEEWEKKNGKLSWPTVILVDFGWAKYYSNKNKYFGSNTFKLDDLHFPGLSPEVAKWLVEKENVVGVGVDTPSLDTGTNSLDPQVHMILHKANKYLLENVAMEGVDLPEKDFQLFVTPMKIKEGTGAPCRIMASKYKFYN